MSNKTNIPAQDIDLYPGVAPDIADDEKVDPALVKQDVKELNNNPRSTDGPKND